MSESNRRTPLRRPAAPRARGLWRLLASALISTLPSVLQDVALASPLDHIDSLRVAYRGREALAAIRTALPSSESSGDTALALALHLREGELLASYGEALAAERVLRPALSLAWTRRDTLTACQCMRWLALAVGSTGRYEQCDSLSGVLLETARRIGATQHQGWARVGLGWSAWTRGVIVEALDQYRAATLLFREAGHPRGEAWALHGLGAALAAAGRPDEARRRYLEVIEVASRIGDPMIACLASNNLGALEEARGDPGAALIHYRRAEQVLRAVGNPREAMEPALNIVACETDLGWYSAAADSLDRLLALCRSAGYVDLEARAQNSLARVRAKQGLMQESRRRYRASLRLGVQVPLETRVSALTGLAESHDDPDSLRALAGNLEREIADLPQGCPSTLRSALLTSLGESRLRAGGAKGAIPALEQAVALDPSLRATTSLGQALLALGRMDEARAVFERALEIWESSRGAPEDPEWREVREADQRILFSELAWILTRQGKETAPLVGAYGVMQRYKARTLIERISGPGPGPSAPDPAPPIDQLQHALHDGEILLDFCLGPRHSHLFVVTRDRLRHIDLPPEREILRRVELYHELVAQPEGAGADPRLLAPIARAIRDLLLPGLEGEILASRRVLLSPDGGLHLLPFSSLLPEATVEWIRSPSAAILVRQRSSDPEPVAHGRSLAVAAPGRGRELSGVRSEVRSLERRFASFECRFLAEDDTLAWGDLGAGWAALHLATHAVADGERPWLSAIKLGDHDLPAAAIARMRIPARLAVLSSCQSTHGRVTPGEGMLGLSSSLLAAGAECVVATLWPVDDRTTAEFMHTFYQEVGRGRTVASALGAARAGLRRQPRTAHPFFWAGFVVIGAGDLRVELSPAPQRIRRAAAGAAGVGLLILWMGLAARRRARHRVTANGEGSPMG